MDTLAHTSSSNSTLSRLPRRVLALDIYGTILNTASIASAIERHASVSADKAKEVSVQWRKYQLEYTWRLNSMGLYEPFDVVTRCSLEQAAVEADLELRDDALQSLMEAYSHLPPYEDAAPALKALSDIEGVELVIFSNGTTDMVTTALKAALPDPFVPMPLFLADWVQAYKPRREIYDGLLTHLELLGQRGPHNTQPDVWLVSGNPFDVTGARAAGLGAIWVDRAGKGWTDRLPLDSATLGPMKIVGGLGELAATFKTL